MPENCKCDCQCTQDVPKVDGECDCAADSAMLFEVEAILDDLHPDLRDSNTADWLRRALREREARAERAEAAEWERDMAIQRKLEETEAWRHCNARANEQRHRAEAAEKARDEAEAQVRGLEEAIERHRAENRRPPQVGNRYPARDADLYATSQEIVWRLEKECIRLRGRAEGAEARLRALRTRTWNATRMKRDRVEAEGMDSGLEERWK